MPDAELSARVLEAARRLGYGDVALADEVLARLDTSEEQGRLAAALLRAARYAVEPAAGAIPARADVEPAMRAHPTLGASLAGILGALSWTLQDFAAHRDWLALHRELGEGTLELAAREAWQASLDGALTAELTDALADRASVERRGIILVEATALRADQALEAGDVALATQKARRASRMARSEGAPAAEYLANLVLARLRRVNGRAHLAARILSALSDVAPRPWHGWLAWELQLAGSLEEGQRLVAGWDEAPAALLATTLDAAQRGDRERLTSAATALRERVAGARGMQRDADAVLAAIDPDAELGGSAPEVVRWCAGEVDDPPAGLHGLCSRREEDESVGACVAYVVARPHQAPRRLLSLALPLVVPAEEGERLRRDTRQQGRADTAIAVLTLAGDEGLDDEAFFRATYGFEYVQGQHRGVFDVLKHRVRKQLGGYSALRREGEQNVLDHGGLAVVPDPRCCQPLSDAVLRALAAGSATAKELARRLSIPLRTAQLALKQLVEEGACLSTREGRQIRYVLEDTTFSEPTRH